MAENAEQIVKTRYESGRFQDLKPLAPGDIVWENSGDDIKPIRMREPEPIVMRFDMRPMNYRNAIKRCRRTRFLAFQIAMHRFRLSAV